MAVTIVGSNAGSAFTADEVDTSYAYDGPTPPAMYYGPGWWYPGFRYGFGPSFGLAFLTDPTIVLVRRPFVHHHPFGHPFARRFILARPHVAGVTARPAVRTAAHACHGGRR
ncbi:MAG: hypothetical protein ABR591_03000 [Candidatus Velthaea sp.]